MSVTTFLLAMGLTARITRFITADVLAQPLRDAVERRFGADSRLTYLVSCAWCASFWVAAAVTVTAWLWSGEIWWQLAGWACAMSYCYGLAASHLD